jgi:hypothetical protein
MNPLYYSFHECHIFHEFVVEHLFEVSGILALCLVFYLSLSNNVYSDVFEEEEYEEDEEYENEEDEEDEEDDMTFEERLDYIETTLSNQLELMQKLNRIEHISEQIEAEKAKGDVLARIETIEQKKIVYEFNITGFNNFCKSVYADVKSSSRIKKRSYIIKKVGKMWRNMEDDEKALF